MSVKPAWSLKVCLGFFCVCVAICQVQALRLVSPLPSESSSSIFQAAALVYLSLTLFWDVTRHFLFKGALNTR
jgi:hypothetical protein